jgi:hypothetical protein
MQLFEEILLQEGCMIVLTDCALFWAKFWVLAGDGLVSLAAHLPKILPEI